MTRSKLSTKVLLLAGGIGLSLAAFAGSQPAAAQSYTCPDGLAYEPSYGCTLGGDYGYYGYPYGLNYGRHFDHRDFGHGMADGTIVHHGMGFHHSIGVANVEHDGFADRGVNVAQLGRGGFAHGLGVAHVGGLGHVGGGLGGFHGGGGFGGGGHR